MATVFILAGLTNNPIPGHAFIQSLGLIAQVDNKLGLVSVWRLYSAQLSECQKVSAYLTKLKLGNLHSQLLIQIASNKSLIKCFEIEQDPAFGYNYRHWSNLSYTEIL